MIKNKIEISRKDVAKVKIETEAVLKPRFVEIQQVKELEKLMEMMNIPKWKLIKRINKHQFFPRLEW